MATAQELLRKRRTSWEVCAGAAAEMRTILNELEEYSGIYEETTALKKRLDRIEKACARGRAASVPAANEAPAVHSEAADPEADPIMAGGDPKTVAQNLIAQMPLQRIFQDPALSDAFLSELLLALARESSGKDRRERQRQGIEEARAQGVRFGAPRKPLPENFEEVRQAWRDGVFSLTKAAEQCGMANSTFYNAAQRAERAMKEAETAQAECQPESSASANRERQKPAPVKRKHRTLARAQAN